MNAFSLTEVGVTLADEPLFQHVTLGIDEGEKIGFLGRNGSGKSTFLRLLNGELAPDEGSLARNRALTISTAEQRPAVDPGASIDDFLFRDRSHLLRPGTEEAAAAVDTYRSYCRELGLPDGSAALGTLSGGMVRKAALARCLALGARFLTLDEPTNHLDLDSIEWLEALLKSASFGFVLVTHDRACLDAVCSSIMEIDGRRIYKYPGNYSAYLERKAERAGLIERTEQRRQSILRVELEWLKRGPRARTGKDKSRKDRIQDLRDAGVRTEMAMHEFSSTHRRLGRKVLELTEVSRSFAGRQVISPFSYSFRRGERIGIIGPNGSGKTTFLNLLFGGLAPDAGTVVKGETTVFALFDQTGSTIDGKQSVIDYVREHAERIPMAGGGSLPAEQFLERFLFPRTMQTLPLERLSGGELRRLTLVRLLAGSPNFLLLDEPTNDLDIDTIRLLEDYLADFTGCILVVSHDRALLGRLTDYLFIFDGKGGIRGFTGSYEAYREMVVESARDQRGASEAPGSRPVRREPKTALSFRERREFESLEAEIAGLEQEQRSLEALFQAPTPDPAGVARGHRHYEEILRLLEQKMARWEELAVRAAE